jgi:uncharacterized protein (TIGR03067 family)
VIIAFFGRSLMKPHWFLILGTMSLLAGDKKEDPAKEELKKLEGTWVLTAVEWDGEKPAPQDVTSDARSELTIHGNKYKSGQVGEMYKKGEGFLRIDPSKKPKTIDFGRTEAFKSGETGYEIYELDGDTLKISSVQKDTEKIKPEDRPKELKTAPKSGVNISYYKRKS